jgi:hypothetical protein
MAIGTSVLGGMATATFLAIFFIPLFFVVVTKVFGTKTGGRAIHSGPDAAIQSEGQDHDA